LAGKFFQMGKLLTSFWRENFSIWGVKLLLIYIISIMFVNFKLILY
jgi:hypothetical protein